jgi:predicted hydrocarbon binding protein
MKKLGYNISDTIIEHFKKRFAIEEKKISNIWMNLFNISGFGKLEIVNLSESGGKFQIKSSNFAKIYLSEYGTQKEPVCDIVCGILEKLFERSHGKKAECKEIACVANGKNACSFEVKVL